MSNYCILIHYHEISIKGGNRTWFERRFEDNVRLHLKSLPFETITTSSARVYVFGIDVERWGEYSKILTEVMGLSNATLMHQQKAEMETIKASTQDMISRSGKKFENFRVSARRQYKSFPMTSGEINVEVGAYIQPIVNKPVKLKGAELEIYIEIVKGMAYVGVDRISGHGGLPVGVSETAVSLLSSGIDSPVSSFEMIKRGVDLTYVHFHSAPSTSRQSIKNVKKLLKILARYQLSCPLHLIPLLEIQQKIMSESHEKNWVLLFRRAMIRLSCMIAEKIDAPVLISGESVGQVASQTLSNIRATADVGDRPILRPLAGMNKEEIITRARKIGTYDISVEPYQDCCSFFVPAHPETKARLNIIQNVEERIQFGDLFEKAISAGEFEIISVH